jgi:hypothetical protein
VGPEDHRAARIIQHDNVWQSPRRFSVGLPATRGRDCGRQAAMGPLLVHSVSGRFTSMLVHARNLG